VDVGLIAQLFITCCLFVNAARLTRVPLVFGDECCNTFRIRHLSSMQREPKSTLLCFAVLSLITSGLAGSLDSEMHDTANYDCIAYVTRGVPRGTRPSCHVTSLRRPGMA